MSLALSRMLLDRFFPDAGGARPAMDWKETPDAHVFKMDLPGLPKERVAVEVVDGRILRVRGSNQEGTKDDGAEKADDDEEEEGGDAVRWHCRERAATGGAAGRQRAFVTQFRLPEDAAADDVSAGMADGVLTVTVPKRKGGTGTGTGKKRRHGKAAGHKPACCRFWP